MNYLVTLDCGGLRSQINIKAYTENEARIKAQNLNKECIIVYCVKTDKSFIQKSINTNQIQTSRSNGIGTAGFVLALIALFLGWIPYIGWVLWFLGFLFSFIGLFKKPSGLAIAGFIISLIDIILLILVFGALITVLSS